MFYDRKEAGYDNTENVHKRAYLRGWGNRDKMRDLTSILSGIFGENFC